MDDIIAQMPTFDHGWYLSSFWRYEDGTYGIDSFTDGDHDGIEEADLPTLEAIEAAWREYYNDVALTGVDPLGQFLVKHTRPERWQFRLNDSIIGPVLVDARRAGRPYASHQLPPHVREWLTLEGTSRKITGFSTWAELEAAQPDVRRNRWLTVTLDGPRPGAAIRRDLVQLARRALDR